MQSAAKVLFEPIVTDAAECKNVQFRGADKIAPKFRPFPAFHRPVKMLLPQPALPPFAARAKSRGQRMGKSRTKRALAKPVRMAAVVHKWTKSYEICSSMICGFEWLLFCATSRASFFSRPRFAHPAKLLKPSWRLWFLNVREYLVPIRSHNIANVEIAAAVISDGVR